MYMHGFNKPNHLTANKMSKKKVGLETGEPTHIHRYYIYIYIDGFGLAKRRKRKTYDFYNVVIVSGIKLGIIKQYI